jgi:bifunctional non-homologous end joining protein LigD
MLVFNDPFPAWIEPCKPALVPKPPEGEGWAHEIKWDGYRVSAYMKGGEVHICTSSGLDWTARFPAIAAAIAELPVQSAVIDGEAVVLDAQGRSHFGDLQAALGSRAGCETILLYAFDLLYFDGLDIRHWPWRNRRAVLEGLLASERGAVHLSEEFGVSGEVAFKVACQHELEGIVSKRIDRPYASGKGKDWLKTKCLMSDTFIIIGYQPGVRGSLGAIHVATDLGDKLHYVGAVGTGFSERAARELKAAIDAIAKDATPIAGLKLKGARWCQPEIRVEVAFRAVTREGLLRHASFKGLAAT